MSTAICWPTRKRNIKFNTEVLVSIEWLEIMPKYPSSIRAVSDKHPGSTQVVSEQYPTGTAIRPLELEQELEQEGEGKKEGRATGSAKAETGSPPDLVADLVQQILSESFFWNTGRGEKKTIPIYKAEELAARWLKRYPGMDYGLTLQNAADYLSDNPTRRPKSIETDST